MRSPRPPIPRTPKVSSQAVAATGSSPATSAASDSGSLIATNASTRQPSRSVSEASARRHSVPVCWVGAGSGGMCASSRRLAWRRSTSARRAQMATAASTSGRPIQIAPSAAPSTSTAVVSAQTRPSGSESVRYSSASPAWRRRRPKSIESGAAGPRGHGPLPTLTSPLVESAWIWNGASSATSTPRTLRRPSSLSASTR